MKNNCGITKEHLWFLFLGYSLGAFNRSIAPLERSGSSQREAITEYKMPTIISGTPTFPISNIGYKKIKYYGT